MGRYDGEYYEKQLPCKPGTHDWAMNGTCWKCNHDRADLIANAKALLKAELPSRGPGDDVKK